MRPFSLQGKLSLLLAVAATAGAALGAVLVLAVGSPWVAIPLGGAILLPVALWLGAQLSDPVTRLLRAMEGAVASYRDSDFSFSLSATRRDEFGDLARMHNQLGQVLREQRQHLVQRELLLDTVVQNTPVALVLTDAGGHVAYAFAPHGRQTVIVPTQQSGALWPQETRHAPHAALPAAFLALIHEAHATHVAQDFQ